jgi:hypothetical protein
MDWLRPAARYEQTEHALGDEKGVHDGWLYLYHIASSMTQTLKLLYSVLIVKYRQNTPLLFHWWREEFRGEDALERVWMRGFVVIRFPMRKALGGRILPAEPRRRRGDPENTRGEAGKNGSCRNSRRLILFASAPATCSHTSMVAFIECRQLKTTLACLLEVLEVGKPVTDSPSSRHPTHMLIAPTRFAPCVYSFLVFEGHGFFDCRCFLACAYS